MSDLISRQAVINTIFYKSDNSCDVVLSTDLMDRIKQLPSVTPERPKGKWIFHKPFDDGHKNCNECIECNQCHTWLGYDCYAKTPYCPNCGAKMESEDKE